MHPKRRYFILTFILVEFFSDKSSADCRDGLTKGTEATLKENLFCRYDSTKPPATKNKEKVKVDMDFSIKRVRMDEEESSYTLNLVCHLHWMDDRLAWNKAEYDSKRYITIDDDSIWRPKLGLVSLKKTYDILDKLYCTVYSDGEVFCTGWTSLYTPCRTDLAFWPYDYVSCAVLLASWDQSAVQISAYSNFLHQFFYAEDNEWDLMSSKVISHNDKINNSALNYIEIRINLQRFSAVYEATVVLPALVICMVTLASSWIQAEKAARLCLVATLFICHVIYLQYLNFILYNNGSNCPKIVLFYRDSMAACGFSLMVVIIVRWIASASTVPPVWISGLVSKMEGSELGYWLLHLESTTNINATEGDGATKNEGKIWESFGTMLDRFAFLVKSAIYFVLLVLYYRF